MVSSQREYRHRETVKVWQITVFSQREDRQRGGASVAEYCLQPERRYTERRCKCGRILSPAREEIYREAVKVW